MTADDARRIVKENTFYGIDAWYHEIEMLAKQRKRELKVSFNPPFTRLSKDIKDQLERDGFVVDENLVKQQILIIW